MRNTALVLLFLALSGSAFSEEKSPRAAATAPSEPAPQVLVRVRILELPRTKLRALGYDVRTLDTLLGDDKAKPDAPKPAELKTAEARCRVFPPDHKLFGLLDTLQKQQLVKPLAEPVLVASNNHPASCLVGGEFPVPVHHAGDTAVQVKPQPAGWLDWLVPTPAADVAVEFKEYGTRVDVLPIVLADRWIHLDFRVKLSQLDAAAAIMVGGVQVPGLRTREVETGVELKSGHTLALSGLVEQRTCLVNRPASTIATAIGIWPREVHEVVNEVETLVLVTPEIVDALPGKTNGDKAAARPGNKPEAVRTEEKVPAAAARPVTLRVKIAELNCTAARALQSDKRLARSSKNGSVLLTSLMDARHGTQVLGQFDQQRLSRGIDDLEKHGVLRILSEPTLVTLSGREAKFVAGGEFAVPTAGAGAGRHHAERDEYGAVTTDFRAFGTILGFTPVVIDQDHIRMQVSAEFSQINTALSVGGTPGLNTRSLNTTVEMRAGQTLALPGPSDGFEKHGGNSPPEPQTVLLITPELDP